MQRVFLGIGRVALWLMVALCLAIVVVPKFLDAVYYAGPKSDHFDGQRFFAPDADGGIALDLRAPTSLFSRLATLRSTPRWPERVDVRPVKPEVRVAGSRMVTTWVGHATFLVQTQGLNILTDPVWSNRVGPLGIGPARVAQPGIRFEDLPHIDLVLVSHDHYDHMDVITLGRLWQRDRPLIVTSLGNDRVIAQGGAQAVARDWGGVVPVRAGIDVVVTRTHHWDSRWFADRNRALWSGFVVRLPGGNLFFAGDTGLGDGRWPVEAAAYGPVRLALIPIGAFRFASGQMAAGAHIGPIDAAEIFDRLGASRALGMHWGTFPLSFEGYDTPPRLLAAVMRCRGTTGFDAVAIAKPVEIGAYAPRPPAKPADTQECLGTNGGLALP